jgi:hypothetical protein
MRERRKQIATENQAAMGEKPAGREEGRGAVVRAA